MVNVKGTKTAGDAIRVVDNFYLLKEERTIGETMTRNKKSKQ